MLDFFFPKNDFKFVAYRKQSSKMTLFPLLLKKLLPHVINCLYCTLSFLFSTLHGPCSSSLVPQTPSFPLFLPIFKDYELRILLCLFHDIPPILVSHKYVKKTFFLQYLKQTPLMIPFASSSTTQSFFPFLGNLLSSIFKSPHLFC